MDAFVDIWQLCTDVSNQNDYEKLQYFHNLSLSIENDPKFRPEYAQSLESEQDVEQYKL